MKKLLLLAIIGLGAWQHFQKSPVENNPIAAEYAALHEEPVILYATDWCGYCRKTRQFLTANQIAYQEYNIEQSTEGRQQYDTLGGQGVPLLLVEGEVIRGYNPAAISQALR